jgi:uncharacterized protein
MFQRKALSFSGILKIVYLAPRVPVFEWDEEKDTSNQKKRGLSFSEAAEAFFDPFNITIPDPDHSIEEERFIMLGFAKGKIGVISFTERKDTIRIISCRKANVKERRLYEQSS